MKTKNILVITGVALLIAGGVYYFAVIKKRSTEAQFDAFKDKSLKTGWDMFLKVTPEKEAEVKMKWLKNLTKSEAEKLIELASKKEKEMSVSELMETKQLISKWLNGSKK